MNLDEMNKKVIPDPLTGDFQTVYWNNEGTFMLCMPHKALPTLPNYKPPKIEWTSNKDGSKSWELKD